MSSWATYRVQMRAEFGFEAAARLCGYLRDLGVTHLYCSPYLQAAPGSAHGYDVTDYGRLGAELGGNPDFAVLVEALRAEGLGQILDIVPNHMSTDRSNAWWWDVLENGPSSRFFSYFDIDWQDPDDRTASKVLVPVLGDDYRRALEAQQLVVERRRGEFRVRYFEHELPFAPEALAGLLAAAAHRGRRAEDRRLAELADGYAALPSGRLSDPVAVVERHQQKIALGAALAEWASDAAGAAVLDDELAALNHDPDRLDDLLERQNYRLAHRSTAAAELNYRRFFNISTLVGLRAEIPEVFEETHRLVLELVRDGVLDGLRVDHVDGLWDPQGYLERLAGRSAGTYTVVEKILEAGEDLPSEWPVAGTSGYDFLNRVNNLFVDGDNEEAMTHCYRELTGEEADYGEVVHQSKMEILEVELVAEVERLTALLATVCERYRRHRDHTRSDLRQALREVVAHIPVYRTYVRPGWPPCPADRRAVAEAVAGARSRATHLDPELLAFLGELALGEHAGVPESEFAPRLQQLTAPVTAKGVEDTAFYRYHRLVSLNEVGGDPARFGEPVSRFHERTAAAAVSWPDSMLTLSTHDTKRSADVRARIDVLSECPDAWRRTVERWMERAGAHKRDFLPEPNVEYLLYQTLVGAWPLDSGRVAAYMAKATKEAKVHTSWLRPDGDYDQAVAHFTVSLLADEGFRGDVDSFLAEASIVSKGRRNSLAQVALLLTCPGVPDIYQGTELWDLSLVDPDNRRPVDYHLRRRLLAGLGSDPPTGPVSPDPGDPGRAKLWLIQRLLAHRRVAGLAGQPTDPYEPLVLSGPRCDDAVAFTRGELAVVVPRRGGDGWAGTEVALPRRDWRDVCTARRLDGGRHGLDELLGGFPVAVLADEARTAG